MQQFLKQLTRRASLFYSGSVHEKEKIILSGEGLSLEQVRLFLEEPIFVELSENSKEKIQAARNLVEAKLSEERSYYGINTGFGKLATKKIDSGNLEAIQENIVRSHAMAVGDPLPENIARLTLLLHANSLAQGFSGVRLEIVESLLNLINHKIIPFIPQKGSLGASGDLALLAHVALALMGEGVVFYNGKKQKASEALAAEGLEKISLKAKEGLSLVNGLAVSQAYALHALFQTEFLIKLSDIVAASSIEGDRSSFTPFSQKVLSRRAHQGILNTGANLRKLLKGSQLNLSHAECSRVQDPYSFRCVPQVHGAVKDCFHFVKSSLEKELSSVTDNPLVFADSDEILSGGNFHGESIAFAADFLSIALTELGALSERRLAVLVDPVQEEIPTTFLTKEPGLHCGLMVPHYVVTNLLLENKTLCTPASIDSLPTSGGQEDHVSQSCWAAQKLGKIAQNVEMILAVELWAASRAIQLVAEENRPGRGVDAIYQHLVKKLPKSFEDSALRDAYDTVMKIVAKKEPVKIVEEAVGELIV